jgi:negative regulator of flagellin synthesis FlgM
MADRIAPVDRGMLGKIGNKLEEAPSTRKTTAGSSVSGASPAKQPEADDTVELTPSAQLLGRAEQRLAEQSGIDRARVDAVRTAIESGNYTIDADKITDALLKSELEIGK